MNQFFRHYFYPVNFRFISWMITSYYSTITNMACSKELVDGSIECKSLIRDMKKAAKIRDPIKDPDPKSILLPLYQLLLEYGDMSEEIFDAVAIKSGRNSRN